MRIGDFGQPRVEAHLDRLLESGRADGTFLFEGPPGSGKEALALELGRLLNCEQTPSCPARAPFTRAGGKSTPAKRCSSCVRFDALQHPDLTLVFPVPIDAWDESMSVGKDGKRSDTIGQELEQKARNPYYKPDFDRPSALHVDPMRKRVLAAAAMRAAEGRVRTIVVSELERITQSNENVLLKTLEEPPPNCLIVLCSAMPQLLMATVRSRAQRIRFAPLEPAWMESRLAALTGAASKDVRFAVSMAQGSMWAALRFLGPEARATRDRAFEILDWAATGRELELLETAQTLAQGHAKARLVVPALLQMLSAASRDALLAQTGSPGLINADRSQEIAAAARAYGPAGLRVILDGAAVAASDIKGNASVEHTLAAFFLDLARAAGQNAPPGTRSRA